MLLRIVTTIEKKCSTPAKERTRNSTATLLAIPITSFHPSFGLMETRYRVCIREDLLMDGYVS